MWVGLLYGIMTTATYYQQLVSCQGALTVDASHVVSTYREKVIQCLVLGKYIRCPPFSIEVVCLYLQIEYSQSADTQSQVWIILGIIVRMAYRMGYHRDGSHSPQITPFQAEMRRRYWAVLMLWDVAIAAQFGLPRMLSDAQSDTAEPRNLKDEDFDEDCTELPPPRPESDPTMVLFLIVKNRLVRVFGRISDLTTSTQSTKAEVMALDKVLHDTYDAMPEFLKTRPFSQSIMDVPELLVGRIFLFVLYLKSQCVLHRKYLLTLGNEDQKYSRSSCIEASLKIIEYQVMTNHETQAGGRLYQDRWRFSSIVRQEFLLATTILCLDLDHEVKLASSPKPNKDVTDPVLRQRVLQALNDSYLIWLQSCDTSREARKAAAALRVVLGKARKAGLVPLPVLEQLATDVPTSASSVPSSDSEQTGLDTDFSSLMADDFDMVSGVKAITE